MEIENIKTTKENKAFRKDKAFNFFGVMHLQRYLRGHKGYIAGGVFKNIFKKQPAKDVDIFFENEEDFTKAQEKFAQNDNYKEVYRNDNAIGYYDKKHEVGIDLVRSQFAPAQEMIEGFDFTITKFALYNETTEDDDGWINNELLVVYHENFFQHLTLNRLVIDGDIMQFPLNTFDRILRYSKYGYTPCMETKVKIVRALNEADLPENSADMFNGFYIGID